jgi:hypothetical protein
LSRCISHGRFVTSRLFLCVCCSLSCSFCVSVSASHQVLYEDNTVNRMDEAVTLFADIANSRWFKNTAMILFLNKKDLFNDKIRKVDIRSDGSDGTAPRFLDYTGVFVCVCVCVCVSAVYTRPRWCPICMVPVLCCSGECWVWLCGCFV